MQEDVWWKGETLLTFLDKHDIPQELYFNLSKTDKELCTEIYAGVPFQIMFNKDHKIEQALIPIGEEMQIHIYKNFNNFFELDIVPIIFKELTQTIAIPIKNSPYEDIRIHTKNKELANEFLLAFKKKINFRKLQKGDMLSIKYKQKIRLGRYFGSPTILGTFIEVRGRKNFIFKNPEDNRYYDEKARSLTSVFLKVPLRYKRVSSKFTYKRWHPILKKYRPHLGVDYAAPTGRKVHATADGKVIHKARKGGYGKTIMIRHKNGYKSLYAHLNSYNKKIKVGSWVKQGQFIGRVGSTGRSTGPHLHFGLYKNGRAVNPQKAITVTKTKMEGKKRKKYISHIKKIKKDLLTSLNTKETPLKLEKFNLTYKIQ
ncbi:MAG: peptidoglycan DD-metalloendopeptidase family protein [Campylobacterota bacterium]|nr:peptidoglycan DD-metalloendopeptidase family protein [Campylobacterota bacterium]